MLCINFDPRWIGLHFGAFSQTHLVALPERETALLQSSKAGNTNEKHLSTQKKKNAQKMSLM
jgi:hypothetical protein